jgi:hypothetical protein
MSRAADLPPPAVARFEFTIDDLLDVGERSMSRSQVVGELRRNAAIAFAVIVAALVFLAAPGPLALRLVAAAAAALLAWAVYGRLRRQTVRVRLRAFWRERLEGDGPFRCEVELTPEGMVVRQFSTTTNTPWEQIATITETADGVELSGRRRGLVVVRERAFATPADKRRFVDYARASLLEQSSASSGATVAPTGGSNPND